MSKTKHSSVGVRPLHDRVLVKRLELGEEVRGGIIIPDTAKEKPQEAEVVAVGPGKLNEDAGCRFLKKPWLMHLQQS